MAVVLDLALDSIEARRARSDRASEATSRRRSGPAATA
jgi:hypothetical protein